MSHSKNPRLYIALTLLLISAILLIARDHRPSFLRPNLRMYAYVSTEEGALSVVDLIALRPIAKIPVGPVIADLREHATRPEIWGVSNGGNFVFVLDTTSNQLSRIPVGPAPYSIDFSPSGDRVYTTASGSDQLVAIDTVSSVSPEYETANASVSGPTKAGVRICFSTVRGTGSSSLNAAATMSPEIPEPPRPMTMMLRTSMRGNWST